MGVKAERLVYRGAINMCWRSTARKVRDIAADPSAVHSHEAGCRLEDAA